jgi:hypothetical protein
MINESKRSLLSKRIGFLIVMGVGVIQVHAAAQTSEKFSDCSKSMPQGHRCMIVADECGAATAIGSSLEPYYLAALKGASTLRCATRGASMPLNQFQAVCVDDQCKAVARSVNLK